MGDRAALGAQVQLGRCAGLKHGDTGLSESLRAEFDLDAVAALLTL